MRGRLVTAQAARAGVPLVIVGAAACWAAVLAAGAGVAVVRCWLVSCCPVLLVVGGLLAGGLV